MPGCPKLCVFLTETLYAFHISLVAATLSTRTELKEETGRSPYEVSEVSV